MANFSITGDQETLKLFEEVTEVEIKKCLGAAVFLKKGNGC